MPAHKLILLPANPNGPPLSTRRLADTLLSIGLVAAARPLGNSHYYPAGENFLQLITFMGCSPNIELQPPDHTETLATASAAGSFCHIFLESSETLRFRADPQMRTPHCTRCRAPLQHWPDCLRRWQENPEETDWRCTHCGASADITTLAFRKTAGFGRTFVEIRGIYPAEAVAGDALLDALQTLSGDRWNSLYIKE